MKIALTITEQRTKPTPYATYSNSAEMEEVTTHEVAASGSREVVAGYLRALADELDAARAVRGGAR